MPANHLWTESEIRCLSSFWETHSYKCVAIKLGLDRGSIVYRGLKLGLRPHSKRVRCCGKPRIYRGPENSLYKGRKLWQNRKRRTAYWFLYRPNHPRANKRGYVKASHVIVEEKMGRLLKPEEIVHHINFDSVDDQPENLAVLTAISHKLVERTLHDLVKALMEKGIVGFDGSRYFLRF